MRLEVRYEAPDDFSPLEVYRYRLVAGHAETSWSVAYLTEREARVAAAREALEYGVVLADPVF